MLRNSLYILDCCCSVTKSSLTLCDTMDCSTPGVSPEVCSNTCPLSWWCHPAISSSVSRFSSCPQSFPASGSFPRESSLHIRWPKYWSFSFSISPSNEYSELISFRIDWFDLAVQRTLNSLLDTSPLSDTDLWVFLPQSSIFSCSLKCLLQSRSVIFDEVLLCRFSFYGLLFWCHI